MLSCNLEKNFTVNYNFVLFFIPDSLKEEDMRRINVILFLVMLCLFVHGLNAESIYVENHSFEEPGTFKTHGWDEDDGAYFIDQDNNNIGPAEVDGWESDGEVIDSGVAFENDKTIDDVLDGVWYGFLMGDDPPVWQLTDHTIAAGEVFTLLFDAYEEYDGPEVKANLYYDDNGTRVVVASTTVSGLDKESPKLGTVIFVAYDAPDSIGKKGDCRRVPPMQTCLLLRHTRLEMGQPPSPSAAESRSCGRILVR